MIDNLLADQINIPYVDRLKDGKMPINYGVVSYWANGQDLMSLVPSTCLYFI